MLKNIATDSTSSVNEMERATKLLRFIWGPLAMVGTLSAVFIGLLIFKGWGASADEQVELAFGFAGFIAYFLPLVIIVSLLIGRLVIKRTTYIKALKITLLSIIGLGVLEVGLVYYGDFREAEWRQSLPERDARDASAAANASSVQECDKIQNWDSKKVCIWKTVLTRSDYEVCYQQEEEYEYFQGWCRDAYDENLNTRAQSIDDCNQLLEEKNRLECEKRFSTPSP
jgi:hypothetical protein